MQNYYFHIEHNGSANKRVYLLRDTSRHNAVERLIQIIGGHDYATGLVRSWQESGKCRPDPGVIYIGAKTTRPHTMEYRELTDADRSVRTVHAEAYGAFKTPWRLIHKTAGYEPAGSCARYTAELWGAIATSIFGGTTYGQWYRTEQEAREHFERVTTPIVEQKA